MNKKQKSNRTSTQRNPLAKLIIAVAVVTMCLLCVFFAVLVLELRSNDWFPPFTHVNDLVAATTVASLQR